MADLSIGVIGAGVIGRRHIEEIRKAPGVHLHAVVDPDAAARAPAAEEGIATFATPAAMFETCRLDGVVIASPNALHVEHGLAAVAAGVPALVEKPVAGDVASGLRLVAAAEQAGVPLLVGHHRRHNPRIAAAKAAVDEGRLGRVVATHGFFWLLKPDTYFETPWRRSPGAGPVLMNLIHEIDLLRHLVGEIETVQAIQSNAVRGHPVDETTVIILRFAGGALGTFNVSDTIVSPWSWELSSGEDPAFPQANQLSCVIGGTHGSLSIPDLRVWRNEGERSWRLPLVADQLAVTDADPMARQIRHFCDVIRGAVPLVPGREGLRTLAVVAAVQQAAESGQSVSIPPI